MGLSFTFVLPVPFAPPRLGSWTPGRDTSCGVTEGDRSPADRAMERYANGDDAAFGELYDLLAPRLLGYLTRQTRDEPRAEDLVQQTLLRMHRARGRFIPGAAVVPWAMAIARRLMIDDLRHCRGDQLVRSIEGDGAAEVPDNAPTAVELVEAAQLGLRIRVELAKLPDAQREAFELVKQEGMSLAEAAAVLGTTVTAVKLRAHRAYVALRVSLGDLVADVSPPDGAAEGEEP